LTEREAREIAGEDAVYDGTKLIGASNDKAKKTFTFKPRRLQAKSCGLWALATTITTRDRGE